MSKENNNRKTNPDTTHDPLETDTMSGGKTTDSFVQNPNHNNDIHKQALGPNAKR